MKLFDTHLVYFDNNASFRDKILVIPLYISISGKITTVRRLFSEHLLQNENKHQIMNVHIKWDCLIPILSSLVKYSQFQG